MTHSVCLPPKSDFTTSRPLIGFESDSRYLRRINKSFRKNSKTKTTYITPDAEVFLFPNVLEKINTEDLLESRVKDIEFEIKTPIIKKVKNFLHRNNVTYKLYGVTDEEMYTDIVDIEIGNETHPFAYSFKDRMFCVLRDFFKRCSKISKMRYKKLCDYMTQKGSYISKQFYNFQQKLAS